MTLQRFYYNIHFRDARPHWGRNCTSRQLFVDGSNEEERIEQVRAFAHKFGQTLKERWGDANGILFNQKVFSSVR